MNPIVWLIIIVLDICFWIVIVSAILSWLIAFNIVNTRNQFVGAIAETLYRLTEPMLAPIRRFLPTLGGIDLSPLVLLVLIRFLQQVVIYFTAQM
ncbi:YggT family protein [Agaricicola taiwanensis]|uniref:YggT family protein n=1 Tax=Agaricicola taiwanensis TaxID=591372 RepID=A0A8J2VIY0_9RHOB|nr:YggT family protein [Agaricicola taiwanensis]GGE27898.1 YggT family protein [Agaricicola taiwanensis]